MAEQRKPRAVSLLALAGVLFVPVLALADAEPPAEGAFTLVVLPDTQTYTTRGDLHRIFLRQTEWIAEHRESHDIRYVLHVGDVVQNNIASEWEVAKQAFETLDATGVPYAIAPGNHDFGPGGSASNRQTLFNDYFGRESAYATQASVGGFFEPGGTESSFHTFRAGGRDWIILALEWGPRDSVVAWADQVLSEHPDHRGIIITHAYVYSDDTRYDWDTRGTTQSWNPHAYGTANDPGGTNDGQELWDKLVSSHDIEFVFCGHVLNDGTGRLTSAGASGQIVHQLLANYQSGVIGSVNGGSGFLRLVEVQPETGAVRIRTYSPFLDEYKREVDQEFTLALCELPAGPDDTVNPCDVRAEFTVDPESGELPLEVRLDAGASATIDGWSIESFEWDLGDGTRKAGRIVTHEYTRAGRFVVRLTVTDGRGLSATTERTVRVTCSADDVSPWTADTIGDPLLGGGASLEGEGGERCLRLCAGGRYLVGRDDEFLFVYREVSGDAALSTRVGRVDGATSGAQIGVMLREDLAPDARFVAMTLRRTSTSTRLRFQCRDAPGGRVRSRSIPLPEGEEPAGIRLKVERRGDDGIGYVSNDAVVWDEIGRTVFADLSGTLYGGAVAIGVESGDETGFDALDAQLCELELGEPEEPAPRFVRGDVNVSGSVNLVDAIHLLEFLSGGAAVPCVDAADVNDDGSVDVPDGVYALLYLFDRSVEIPAPGALSCGSDRTPDELDCGEFPSCR